MNNIWFIGFLFSWGAFVSMARYDGLKLRFYFLAFALLLIGWPVVLGMYIVDHINGVFEEE